MEKLSISGHTRLGGFLASPASHSISPKMYNTAFEATGIDLVYLAFNVNQEHFGHSIQTIRSMNMFGANVSMPNKLIAVDYMDEISEAAELIGAINTIVHNDGKLSGHNTDGIGFCDDLRKEGLVIEKTSMTILGAGGTAAAIVCQAALDGMQAIHIFNRPGKNYDLMEEKIKKVMEKTSCVITLSDWDDHEKLVEAIAESNLLTNATSVGMKDSESPLKDLSLLREDLVVYDVIYEPRETQLLKDAKKVGAKAINGLGMLLYQGAAAFKLYTGKEMPIDIVKPIVENS